uniref:Uncharacterized protein n=1 Tax=Corvus moneduloides TaxID=1196302 RepID=A0A8C3E798_CORMO
FLPFFALLVNMNLKPQTAAPQLATNSPTLTTVALENPFCMFDNSLHPNKSYNLLVSSAIRSMVTDSSSKVLDSTFQQAKGGAAWTLQGCFVPSVSKISDNLKQYLFIVGNDGICLYDLDFLDVCNPPLASDTTLQEQRVPLHLSQVNGLPGLQRIIPYPLFPTFLGTAYSSYLYHARTPGMVRQCLTAGLVHSEDSSLLR